LQLWLHQHNTHLIGLKASLAPDGDADVREELIRQVQVPDCRRCGGLLKPNVVFYGSSVGKELVSAIYRQLDSADGLLVVGSSLMVYSSFRFCRYASQNGIPMACINQGVTRADPLFQLKVASDCGPALTALVS
ncbi:MAG: Sir2 family NAD-dependent protein deacetylase, partial [Gammaproteobacteria bacterium]